MGSIFISYRRAGTSGYGGRLQEDLRQHFGKERVFRDIDSIRPGTDFARVIEQAVAGSGVVLVLIGGNWLDATNENGQRRLDDPDDFVRLEIESALNQDITVVPVLVEGALAPSPSALPPSISRLGRMQAIELSDLRWDYDVGRLIDVLDEIVGPAAEEIVDLTALEAASSPAAAPADAPAGLAAAGASATTTTRVLRRRTVPQAAPDPGGAAAAGGPVAGPPGPTRNRRLIAVAAAIIVVVVAGVLAATGGGSPEVHVPSVVGEDVAVATTTLRKAGLEVRTRREPSDATAEGAVVAQAPKAGTSVRKGGTVDLVVAGAIGTLPVPAVTTLDRAAAVAAIEGAGLVAAVVEQRNEGVPAGIVFQQLPEPAAAAARGSTVTLTVSTGAAIPAPTTTRPPVPTTATTRPPVPGSTAPTSVPTTATTAPTPPTTAHAPLATANLVVNPGAEDSPASAPFTVGQAPAGWSRGAFQAIAAAYGATGQRTGCDDAAYPSAGDLQGSGSRLFSGGFDGNGGCELPGGSVPTLTQVLSLAGYAGRTDGAGWQAGARLASWPGSGDGAELVVEVLGGSGQVLGTSGTGVVSNASGFAFQTRNLSGTIPSGAASVRLTLRFPVSSSYSGGFADDISFRFG
ncbi:MAG TPA: PASTA domain-containing protein [Acidimicrobiales bacterium]|nr:PASTA domain-containing protein [Acidimicrobiales bacterium]